MTAAEAHSEALRRIQAAKTTGQHWLDLGDIQGLERIPGEIAELTALRELGLGTRVYDQDKNTWEWEVDRWFLARPLVDLSPLAGLSALQTLDLSGTPMGGSSLGGTAVSDLSPLAGLSVLQTLDVSGTAVSDLSPLASLSALQTLTVMNTSVSDLSPLVSLSGLRKLSVSGPLVSDLSPLASLSALQTLHVRVTSVSDLSPLASLSTLQTLHVSGTSVSDLSPLASLSTLQTLHVSGMSVSDLKPLASLSALQTLHVSGTSVSDLSPLASLNALQSLTVNHNTPVSDLTPLAGLSALQSLDFSDTSVSDLSPLAGLAALQSLKVSGTSVSDLLPLVSLSTLQSLNVSHTSVSDLKPLANLSTLQSLDVSYTSVSDLLPLVGLSALQTLKVIGTLVSDLTPLASLSALQTLDVSYTSVSDLTPLAGLSALQTLDVSYTSVSDLTPLAGLSALQTHDVSGTSVSDLSPLAGLSALQTLHVTDCQNVGSWEPLREHEALHELIAFGSGSAMLTTDLVESLPALEQLIVHRLLGVPPEVLSENEDSNCLSEFRSWAADLRVGEDKDQEVKIFVLGNGTAGKTQICRQLRGEGYDDQVPSTHGVQIGHFPLLPDAGRRATKAKLWDFGGQDIYHGTHALFLEGRAVFILVWSREVEAVGDYEESGLSMHHHRLTYWLDYVRSLAGEDAALVVVQAKCDLESDRTNAPLPTEPRFKRPLPQVTCSAKLGEMDELNAAIRSATRYLLEVHGTYRLPASWAAVRDKLRELKLKEKTVSRERFDELCRETHGTSVPAALLSYLHRSGEVFYREGLFKDEIVLDQEWALRAIYAVLDRNGPCQVLRQMGGTFTLPILSSLAWRDEFSEQEQATILGMMASCAICFPLDERHHQSIQRYALPDLLPLEAEAKTRVEALWRPDLAAEKVTLEYSFLHAGILRQFLCEIGSLGGPDAAYWRYGCCFYDSTTHSRARIRAEKAATPEAPARGRIVIETCDGNARELLTRLQKAITEIRIGQPPQVMEEAGSSVTAAAEREDSKPLAETLKIVPAPLDPAAKPQVWLSYGWGASDDMVGRLEARLNRADYDVRRDVSSTKLGQRILDFEREIGRGARVIVIISTKYLESIHCMRELLLIHQHSQGDQTSFLSRVVPLILEDVNIRDDEQRLDYVGFWVKKHEALDQKMGGLPRSALGTTPETLAMMQQFYQCAQPILAWLADVLMPRGITDIEKDDFAAVIAALKAKG